MVLCRARDGLSDPCGSLPSQGILWFCANATGGDALGGVRSGPERSPHCSQRLGGVCVRRCSALTLTLPPRGQIPFSFPGGIQRTRAALPGARSEAVQIAGDSSVASEARSGTGGVTLHTSLYKKVIQVRNK